MLLFLYHVIYAFLESIFGDEAVNHDIALLAYTVGAVGSLCFNGRIPPKVVMNYVVAAVRFSPVPAALSESMKILSVRLFWKRSIIA